MLSQSNAASIISNQQVSNLIEIINYIQYIYQSIILFNLSGIKMDFLVGYYLLFICIYSTPVMAAGATGQDGRKRIL